MSHAIPAPLSAPDRLAIARHLTSSRARIVAQWSATQLDAERLRRWNVAGIDGQDLDSLRATFVAPLFDLLVGAIERDDARQLAVYRDERLRYAPHQASPFDRAKFFSEIIPPDEQAVVDAVEPTVRDALRAELALLHAPLLSPPSSAVRVLAVGDCLMNEIRVFLPDASRRRGFDSDTRCLYFSAFSGRDISTNQVREFLSANPIDVLAFSFLSYEGLPMYSALLRDADRMPEEEVQQRVTAIVGMMRRFLAELRELTDAPFLVHNASGLPLTRYRRRVPFLPPLSPGRRRVLAVLNAAVAEMVEHTPNTLLIDEDAVARRHGHRESMRSVVPGVRGALFHTARFGEFLSEEYADVLDSYRRLKKTKVLAVDFDNTLWEGVMADGDVTHHHDRQRLLRELKDAGILLVAVSKNDPANVRWPEMTLAQDDFVLQKIGWGLKVESISGAAKQLDLGIDSFVFIDDNPAECELVRSQLPKVQVLDSNDGFSWRSLRRLLRFPATKHTAEAKQRTEMYRQQAQRLEAMSGAFDYPALMAGLDLRLEFRRAVASDLDRLTELVQRTNQFNTTTKRYSRQQLQQFLTSDRHRVYVAALSDKFGALGLVLTAIVERQEDDAIVDSFVMSCRAMGFQMEQAVMSLVLDAEPEGTRWTGLFVATDRNSPAASLFADCGFQKTETGWVLLPDAARPPVPQWFAVESDLPIAVTR